MTGMDWIEVSTTGPVSGIVAVPGSKSLTNRALICAALADGVSALQGALRSEDTEVMIAGLRQLGFDIEIGEPETSLVVRGAGGKVPASQATLDLQNSGTSIRFLTALCALGSGTFQLDGIERMRQRPIEALCAALRQLGTSAEATDGCPPVTVQANGLPGGTARLDCSESSQFLSALLMVMPAAQQYSVLQIDGPIVSQPFIDLTCNVMRQFGVDVCRLGDGREFSIDPRHRYQATNYLIEPDATAASYFWGAAAITGGSVLVEGLDPNSIQGDFRFVQLLEEMGCDVYSDERGTLVSGRARYGIEANLNDISDTAQTLAAVALFAESPSTITGIAHNRNKETDRITNLAIELRKLGADVRELPDGLHIVPTALKPATLETWNDHRMAMSFAIAGLGCPGIRITNPECTRKTFPGFFSVLRGLLENPDA